MQIKKNKDLPNIWLGYIAVSFEGDDTRNVAGTTTEWVGVNCSWGSWENIENIVCDISVNFTLLSVNKYSY